MIYLLDTNLLIYLIKKKPPQVADRIDALPAAAPLLYIQYLLFHQPDLELE